MKQSLETLKQTRRGTRIRVVALVVAGLAVIALPLARPSLAAQPASKGTINIGVKNFAEEQIIADMYQLLLQKAGFTVQQHSLAETPALQSALRQGSIDLYPEYTGTGLFVLYGKNAPIVINPIRAYDMVKTQYERRYHITWLLQAPMNDTNGVAVTPSTASKYHLHDLSSLAKAAGKLTFADDPACPGRPDCLGGMQRYYGIHFKSVTPISSVALRHKALKAGQYDVVEVFTTDAPIQANHEVVLPDNKAKVFPADHIAPVVRDQALAKYPAIRTTLNPLASHLTTAVMIRLNGKVILQSQDPMAVARSFLRSHHMM